MKRQYLYAFIFISFFTACLDSPEMTTGIVNGKEIPTVETDSTGTLYSNGNLRIQGKILSEGKSKISERGFFWSIVSNNPGFNDNNSIISLDNSSTFTCELKNIVGDTIYYWRAYAKNGFGIEYAGDVYSFRTPKDEPEVATISINTFINEGIILFKGEIKSEGKSEIIERGFCWSATSENPTVNDDTIRIQGADFDEFSYELKSASGDKTYYCRAYAKNSLGYYGYGNTFKCETPQIWEQITVFSPEPRGNGAICLVNNNIYLICGETEWGRVPLQETYIYDIANEEWEQRDRYNFPGGARVSLVVFPIGNYAYVGTGRNPNACNDFYKFNIDTKIWSGINVPNDLDARSDAVAFSMNGKGYVVGGYGLSALNDVWQYNPVEDSWERKNNFPFTFFRGISIYGNNRAFVGFSETGDSRKILWEYIEETDSWSEFTTLPDYIDKKIYSGVIVQNVIYIVDADNKIWACDTSNETKTWEEKATLPDELLFGNSEIGFQAGFQIMLSTVNSNSIYVGLGYTKYLFEYRPLWDN